jgi:hypothetical protein
MKRVRWLNAQWPTSMRTIGSKMKSMPFTEDSVDGFTIERIREDFLTGRFIEKYVYEEINSDPFGKDEVIERIGYRSTDFTLYSQFPHIEIHDGQRSIKDFVNRLLETCSFNLTITPVSVNLLEWILAFQVMVEQKLTVDSLQVSNVELEDGIAAKILIKGDRDVREAVDRVVEGRKYVLEKLQVKMILSGARVAIHLANNGSVKVPVDHSAELLPLLRKAIPQRKS